MKHLFSPAAICLLMWTPPAAAQPDPAAVAPEQVATGFRFTEGPAVAPDGGVYFTDQRASLILRYDPLTGETETVRENSGEANGLMFNDAGNLYACEGGARRVSVSIDGVIETVADQFDGRRFNSPNDLTIDNAGGIYFTDPRYGRRDDMEMDVEAVYYIARGGAVTRIIDDLVRPNGVILSLDGTTLYVADNGTATVFAYDVVGPGQLANKRRFAVMDAGRRASPDGMTVDATGKVYAAGGGGVWVWDASGARVGFIPLAESPTNCTFTPDFRTLYITAGGSLYRMQMVEMLPGGDEPNPPPEP